MSPEEGKELFSVGFEGQVAPGRDPLEVKQNLARLFRCDLETVEKRLFTGKRVIVRKNLDRAGAEKVCSMLKQAGAKYQVYRQKPTAPRKPPPVAAPAYAAEGEERRQEEEQPPEQQPYERKYIAGVGYADALYSNEPPPDTRSFIERLPGAFTYPFRGQGPYIFAAGVIALIAVDFFWPLGLLAYGFIAAYLMNIINETFHGSSEVPNFQDYSEICDVMRPMFQMLVIGFVSYFPYFFYFFISVAYFPVGPSPVMLIALLILCTLYFPMALIAFSITRSYVALSPHIVLRMISLVPLDYAIACVFMFVIVLIEGFSKTVFGSIPFLGLPLEKCAAFYFFLVEAHVLGLIMYTNREALYRVD